MTADKRFIEVDIVKGFLIVFVVLGHSGIGITNIIYWFHMPAFFCISGFLFKELDLSKNVVDFVLNKAIRFLIPYVSYLILIILASSLLKINTIDIFSKEFFIRSLVGGKLLVGQFGVFWFITSLLGTILLYTLLKKIIKKESLVTKVIIVFFILGHIESYIINTSKIPIIVPLNIDVCLVSLMYFYIGVQARKTLFEQRMLSLLTKKVPSPIYILCSLLLIMGVIVFLPNYKMDLKYQYYFNILLSFFVPIAFIYLLVLAGSIIKNLYIHKLFELLGYHSLAIMYLHLLIKEIMIKSYYNIWLFTIVGSIIPLLFSYFTIKNKYTLFLFHGTMLKSK